ncbi:guanine nucleotide exchange factor DBS-like protein [Lates japonicus]|uniref:Guanine nucleotide exchange factor DBS-like protein n=1 Tax=Lates japonicus TaxID=270547 RepID=A0AAD3NHX5_LATJO|nr:guanine nucleotide exchange factor DBS-like protein [Lates japonicus]
MIELNVAPRNDLDILDKSCRSQLKPAAPGPSPVSLSGPTLSSNRLHPTAGRARLAHAAGPIRRVLKSRCRRSPCTRGDDQDPLNSDPEDDNGKKLCVGKYTVMADYEKGSAQELSVKSGDMVQLLKERDDGQWLVRNLSTSKEGWIAAANLITLIGKSKSCQSLTSSEGSGSGNLSTSSSCSETYTSFSDIKP